MFSYRTKLEIFIGGAQFFDGGGGFCSSCTRKMMVGSAVTRRRLWLER